MRLLVTSDLHYNHGKSTALADDLIASINRAGGDVLLLVGDTAVSDGDALEQCLSRFHFSGTKLFLAGNHELWTNGYDSYRLFTDELPRRVEALGWQWLETRPFIAGEIAIVGTVGWYDYSFAQKSLGIPDRFYREKISPGAASMLEDFQHLLESSNDVPRHAMSIVARWNDGKFVKLHRSDPAFLDALLVDFESRLSSVAGAARIIAATHHLPFAQLLPPAHSGQWDFTKAYLGSPRIGQTLLKFPNITHVFCGHSHFPAEAQVQHVRAINPGNSYRFKIVKTLDIPG
jgi:3',5'-cyclic AMP phosphodiesterase CpdA